MFHKRRWLLFTSEIHAWLSGEHVMTDDVIFPKFPKESFSPPFKLLVLADSVPEAIQIELNLSGAEIVKAANG